MPPPPGSRVRNVLASKPFEQRTVVFLLIGDGDKDANAQQQQRQKRAASPLQLTDEDFQEMLQRHKIRKQRGEVGTSLFACLFFVFIKFLFGKITWAFLEIYDVHFQDHPELETRGIRLEDVIARAQTSKKNKASKGGCSVSSSKCSPHLCSHLAASAMVWASAGRQGSRESLIYGDYRVSLSWLHLISDGKGDVVPAITDTSSVAGFQKGDSPKLQVPRIGPASSARIFNEYLVPFLITMLAVLACWLSTV